MNGQIMVTAGYVMVAGAVVLTFALNIIFAVTKKKMIAKIYNEIENN